MNLFELSKISDSRAEDYKESASALPNNFYAQLISKVESFVRKTDKAKSADRLVPLEILGNKVRLEYDSARGLMSVNINGRETYRGKYGKGNTIDSVVSTIKSEVKGDVAIKRPKGYSIWKERQDFSKKNLEELGLSLPQSLYKAMEGKGETSIVKLNRKSKKLLTVDEYNYLVKNDQIDKDQYNRITENYYLKVGSPFFVLKREYNDVVNNIDEIYAREKGFQEFSDENRTGKAYVVSGDDIFVLANESLRRQK